MRSWIAGNRFTAELLGSGPIKLRIIWELIGDGTVTWTNEGAVNDGPWFLIEEYVCSPLADRPLHL